MALEDILGAVTLLILPVCCRWNGAPVGSCRTMDPKHNVGPKEIPHGYTLKTENEGMNFNVTLSGDVFKGFMIRAMIKKGTSENYLPGKFHSTDSAIKWLRCDGNDASAVTHGNSERKNLVTVSWTGFTSPKHTPNIFFSLESFQGNRCAECHFLLVEN
ncbi:putative ferric-chelate reductase 1 isoform X2 [Ornithodoros turicata]|uniref:putative ferric-chelate reductase 1 isoform X2 n=1 Tax=Ornithodoros turicata TaxID=34597 RepID=UPI003139ACA5